jgi:fucose permease
MIGKLDKANRRLFIIFLFGFAVFGMIYTIPGAALPQLIRNYGWSYAVTGLVLAASAAGYVLATFLCGFLVQRIPAKAVLLAGLIMGGLGVSLFGRFPSPWLNLGLNLVIGICQGTIELVANLEIIHMERDGQSRLMNLLHAAICIGAIAGPSAVGFVSGAGGSMLSVFLAGGILLLVMAVLVGSTPFPRVSQDKGARQDPAVRLMRQPILVLVTILLLVYVGIEIGVFSWSSEYFVKVLGTAASWGAYAVALIWGGLLMGRLAVSFWYKGRRQEIVMVALAAFSAAMILLMLLVRSTAAIAAALFLAGLGLSGFYPLGMSVVGRYYKSGVAVGMATAGGGAGSVIFPLLMSVLSQAVGIRGGFWFYFCLNCVLVILAVVLVRLVRHRAAA